MSMHDVLERCPVVIETPVAWGQMDAFRHLNNTAYFRFFESARIAYFEKLDLLQFMEPPGLDRFWLPQTAGLRSPLLIPIGSQSARASRKSKTIASRWNTTSLVINIRELPLKGLA